MCAAAARTASQLSVFESGLDEETILVAMRELQRGAADGAPHREGPDKHGDVEDGPPPEEEPGCVYLEGSRRKVDFILVYSPAKNQAVRDIFEEELLKAGLLLDYVPQNQSGLCYIKIHAPWDVLSCFAEIMRLKMPVKEVEVARKGRRSHKQFAVTFSMSKEYLFDIPPCKEDFFSSAQRAQIVHFILQRKSFSRKRAHKKYDFGVSRLLADGVYLAAFPLHEGSSDSKGEGSPRAQLRKQWASLLALFRGQPLDHIRRYFGVKVGLYFAWLGFYTYMLIPASVVGLACFLYGVFTLSSHVPVREMCADRGSLLMCPLCDNGCEYWRLQDSCTQAKLSYLFDNGATVFFVVFMSVWGAAFLELWKRYSARITYQWDLSGFDTLEENARPEYLARLSKIKKRDIELIQQDTSSDSVPFWKVKLPYSMLSCSVILLLVLLAVAAVVGVIVYRMSVRATLALSNDEMSSFIPLITSTTAALLNLLCILLFNMVYTRLAVCLTDMEMPRTQTEYDDSLTLKMYLLQFVNCYSSIFYIAFFKGKFVGRPGKYNLFLNYQQEECGAGGCFLELSIQLAIIMVGKQAFGALSELALPYAMRLWSHLSLIRGTPKDARLPKEPWERDYTLPDMGTTGLFQEYLEMILQYGFVTVFVAAFPLAPLFALLNNTLEIRLDALKLLGSYRRPVGVRVRDIGIWYRIMDSLGKLAVLTNAVIIAFTSDLVPRMYYRWKVSPEGSLEGFVDFSLSYFDVRDYGENVRHGNTSGLLDVPKSIREKIREDNKLTNEIIILQELKRRHAIDPVPV
ncbi:transmembrane protein 16D, putative [Ixodes scapularis]|uniref:Anoctamin n=1 Tax=Ixodes scapularis TaxID=6945 RepID=B7QNT9_IXOSC|nr:transmembrane protein 16D, putative [Ixodes scapularis]|eukprot:XP_002416594.1 transmembrane protein 16D, putative [Ixodes scapularis]